MIYPSASLQRPTVLPLSCNDPTPELDHHPETEADVNRHDGWLVSFVDILILLITLFVVLLTYQDREQDPRNESDQTPTQQEAQTAATSEPSRAPLDTPFQSVAPAAEEKLAPMDERLVPSAVAAKVSDAVTTKARGEEGRSDARTPPVPATSDTDQRPRPATHSGVESSTVVQSEGQEPLSQADTEISAARAPRRGTVDRLLESLRNSELRDRIEVRSQGNGFNVEISDSILFEPASAALSLAGSALLETLAETLREQPYPLAIEGHTDKLPIKTAQFPSNWELSAARASAVARHLIKRGMSAERIRTIGYASTRPRAQNRTPEGRSRNRRVTLVLQLPASHAGGH